MFWSSKIEISLGAWGAWGALGTLGAQRACGALGTVGTLAARGELGTHGALGTQSTESMGSTGNLRSTGNTGSMGSTRKSGNTGSMGRTGNSGSTRNTGHTGSTWRTGNTWSTGNMQSTGTVSSTGSTEVQISWRVIVLSVIRLYTIVVSWRKIKLMMKILKSPAFQIRHGENKQTPPRKVKLNLTSLNFRVRNDDVQLLNIWHVFFSSTYYFLALWINVWSLWSYYRCGGTWLNCTAGGPGNSSGHCQNLGHRWCMMISWFVEGFLWLFNFVFPCWKRILLDFTCWVFSKHWCQLLSPRIRPTAMGSSSLSVVPC